MNKKSFTITELIITGIIILAVITTTLFIKQDYTRHELYNRFRTSLTKINLALNMSVIENGSISQWDFFNGDVEKILTTYFEPYLKDSIRTECISFNQEEIRSLNGSKVIQGCKIYGLSSDIKNGILRVDNITFGLYNIDKYKKQITITLDINGFNQPNIIGRDIYRFEIKDSIYEPSVNAGRLNQNCSLDLLPEKGVIQGLGCADRLMSEGTMNY